MTARPRTGLAAALVALALATVAPVAAPGGLAGVGATPLARGAATDLTLVTDAVYTVHPDDARVAVALAIDAHNHTKETRTRRFWFDHAFLAVQPGATNLRLTGPTGARVRVAKRTPQATLLRLDFGTRIYSGKSAALRLAFDLPGSGKAASPDVRVGDSLVTLPVWAFASNGAKGSTVMVRIPGEWDVAVETGELNEREAAAGEGTVLVSGPIASPLTWFAYVTAQRPAEFMDRAIAVDAGDGPIDLVLQGWTDDAAWSRRVESLFRAALPALRAEIGTPWPMDRPLVIAESVSRDADAYAGLFDPDEHRMEIAYWADPGVIVHQAAHGWFNGSLLADRWANEGFATLYGLRAAEALGEAAAPPVMTDEARAASIPLAAWPGSSGSLTAQDAYGSAASYELAADIADAVGEDVLAAVWADAAAGTGAYQPPAASPAGSAAAPSPIEGVAGPADWRALLDLLEARSGQDLAPLWRARVVDAAGAAELDERATAREAYARTLLVAGDWQLPRAIRDAMRAWDFATARSLMADARTVLAQRNAVADLAAREGLVLPAEMRLLFEDGALAEASARAEAEQNAILAMQRAEASRSTGADPLRQIGMLGEDPETDLAQARAAIERGDLETAREEADRAYRAWTVAWEEGRRRALLGLAMLATLLVLASAVPGHMRRSRRAAAAEAAGPALAASSASSAPDDRAASA